MKGDRAEGLKPDVADALNGQTEPHASYRHSTALPSQNCNISSSCQEAIIGNQPASQTGVAGIKLLLFPTKVYNVSSSFSTASIIGFSEEGPKSNRMLARANNSGSERLPPSCRADQ